MELVEIERWLDGFLNFERTPDYEMLKLVTMERMCEKFRHPEREARCIHITGSKGKGTIAANIAGILRGMGYKTGVYGSPHVLNFSERVGTGAGDFSRRIYEEAFSELKSGVEELLTQKIVKREHLTWFELTTMFGMLCFRAAKVDFAVYEVGIGGRLDATNVILPEICVFGPIEVEHTKYLGDSLGEIAREKAGILKPGATAVSAAQKLETREVLKKRAEKLEVELEFLPELEDYLAEDRAIALAAVQKIFPNLDRDLAQKAMAGVNLPGRFERLTDPVRLPDVPYLLFDGAHTANSMSRVIHRMKAEGVQGKVIFGCAQDKNADEMAKIILQSGLFSEIYLTRPGDFKASDLESVARAFRKAKGKNPGPNINIRDDFRGAIVEAITAAERDRSPIVVLGSFYLVGEVKKVLAKWSKRV